MSDCDWAHPFASNCVSTTCREISNGCKRDEGEEPFKNSDESPRFF